MPIGVYKRTNAYRKKMSTIKTKKYARRICRQCEKPYDKNKHINHVVYSRTKYCSPKCAGLAKKIHADANAKSKAYRRRKGMSVQGSPEHLEKLSRLTKLAMQRPEVQEKIRRPKGALSLERRMEISNLLAGKMPKNMLYPNQGRFPNVQRGYYDINGTTMYFRSKWEANYALYLDFLTDHKEILKWEFEPDTFMFEAIKLGTRSYTPDFKVFNTDGRFEYHEIKGYMDSKSKTKLKRFAKYYPEHKLVLVDSAEYDLLKKQIGKLCGFY